ncbi:hypothetical protein J8F10_24210 [Gemmata sp. G18]|uniref:Uncharacterized protein n=1 Tax=Gemmata palustris TaxID=2822762 RepID=A0ABS5BXH5_9BACT|nr:hypothetical protein [Gemmata palustris]MBP3958365.1 hypothetical protein [Gemmata palustris]
MTNISNELRELLEVNAPELLAERENEDAEAMRQAWFRVIEGHLQRQAKRENAPDVLHATDENPNRINGEVWQDGDRVLHESVPDHSEQQLDMVERVAMGSEQVQLGSKLNLSEELETALKHLVALKDHKEAAGGKTLYYEREQPLAWEQARRVLVAVEERRSMSSEQVQNRDTLNLSEAARLTPTDAMPLAASAPFEEPDEGTMDWKELAYEMADQLGMALLRLRHTSEWTGTLRNHETGLSYTWEESFARSIEKLPGLSVDRRYLEAKSLPAKDRRAEYRRLDAEIATRDLKEIADIRRKP